MTINTSIGWCYCATFTQNGTISDANGNILATCKADSQTTFQATTTKTIISDNAATVLPVDGSPATSYSSGGESTTVVQITVEQTFDATSTNAQSGIAVQEAVKLGGGERDCINIGTGACSQSGTYYAIALGYNAIAKNTNDISIGNSSSSNQQDSIAIGRNSKAHGEKSLAIGYSSYTDYMQTIAIGDSTKTQGYGSVSIGSHSEVSGDYSAALGANIINKEAYSTALIAGQSDPELCAASPINQVHFFTMNGKVYLGIVQQLEGVLYNSWAYDLSQLTPTDWTPEYFKLANN